MMLGWGYFPSSYSEFTSANNPSYTLGQLVSQGYQVFDDSWGTFIKEHKAELCEKIVKHYYFNEICCDQPDRFRHYLNEQLARIMPYYNQMYESELIKFDPISNHFIKNCGGSLETAVKQMNSADAEVRKTLTDLIKSGTSKSDFNDKDGIVQSEAEDYTRDYTENKEKNETENTRTDTTTTDTLKRDMTSNSVSDGNTSETTDNIKKYSDTPQKKLTGEIDETYLTNYTHDSEKSTTTSHDETNTTGTQNDARDISENEVKERTLNGTEDTTGNIKDHKANDKYTDRTRDTLTNGKTFENGRVDESRSKGVEHTENETASTDRKENSIINGYMNMPASALLNAFRQTFLNIDSMIIEELKENFMEVYLL